MQLNQVTPAVRGIIQGMVDRHAERERIIEKFLATDAGNKTAIAQLQEQLRQLVKSC